MTPWGDKAVTPCVFASDVTVQIASSEGTATSPEDFEEISETVTFESDESTPYRYVDVAVSAVGTSPQTTESSFTVTLSSASGATIEESSATVTIKIPIPVPLPSKVLSVTLTPDVIGVNIND